MPRHPRPPSLRRYAAYRAAVAACTSVGRWLRGAPVPRPHGDQLRHLATEMCCELALGFAAPPDSLQRASCHHRAWTCVRQLDASMSALVRRGEAAPAAHELAPVQRAIDRADVMIGALPSISAG